MPPYELIYTGIRHMHLPDEDGIDLGGGLSLAKPNRFLLSGRMRLAQNEDEYEEAERVSRFLVYRYRSSWVAGKLQSREEADELFFGGLMALQVVKPVRTLGFIYRGEENGSPSMNAAIERRLPMEPGEWALVKQFDECCLSEAVNLIPKLQKVTTGSNVELKNSAIALQLGLELNSFHPYLSGLLWVMGLEAIFDSGDKHDFKKKLCDCLGPNTKVFPDWTTSIGQPSQLWTKLQFRSTHCGAN